MTDYENWKRDAEDYGWVMPKKPWWKKLFIIRHIRALYHSVRIALWYAFGPGSMIGQCRNGFDSWILYGIWNKLEN